MVMSGGCRQEEACGVPSDRVGGGGGGTAHSCHARPAVPHTG